MVRLGPVLTEDLFEPLELLAGHPGRDLSPGCCCTLYDRNGTLNPPTRTGHFMDPRRRKKRSLSCGPARSPWHLEVSPKSILVKRNGIRRRSSPRIVPDLMVTESGVDLEIMILEQLMAFKMADPTGIIHSSAHLLISSFFVPQCPITRSPATMAKAGSSFFMEPTMNPRGVLPPFLGILDVEIEEKSGMLTKVQLAVSEDSGLPGKGLMRKRRQKKGPNEERKFGEGVS